MGKDSKPKDSAGKGKGKQPAGGGDDGGSKGKGKGGKGDGLGTCTYVKARHILCEKQGKINEAYKKLQDGWLSNGDKVPPAEFAKLAAEYSECPSGKKGGDLGWFPRGKMAGPFQEVAFNTPVGVTSAPFKSTKEELRNLILYVELNHMLPTKNDSIFMEPSNDFTF
ncbi:UNVERIFIED_CONTAM: Foldase protein PrsA [Sesamum indicum]